MFFCCFICNLKFNSVYIKCMDCIHLNKICLNCFSNGLEHGTHQNDHSYKVVNMDELTSFDGWSVQQELELIEQIELSNEFFFLNSVSDTHTLSHIEKWQSYFLGSVRYNDEFDRFINDYYSVKTSHRINMFKKLETEQVTSRSIPIRPQELSNLYKKMNGYRAARGDFETEMNDKFELKVAADLNPVDLIDITEEEMNEDKELESQLVSVLIDSYQELISERYERKKFIKKFGLLNECYNSNQLLMGQFGEQAVKFDGVNRSKTTHIIRLQKVFECYDDYVKFLEIYNHQSFLIKRIEELEGKLKEN